nr:hypothetical protein [Ktedonobacteraceae bacterium]
MDSITTLGLSERLERVLAYLFGWVSGLLLFLVEKNRNVRWQAAQSLVTFGSLSLLSFGVGLLRNILGWIPIIGGLTVPGLTLLLTVLGWVTVLLWIWLMVMAWNHPNYRLPFVCTWVDSLV